MWSMSDRAVFGPKVDVSVLGEVEGTRQESDIRGWRDYGISGWGGWDAPAAWFKARKRWQGIGCQCVEYEHPRLMKKGGFLFGAVWWFFQDCGVLLPIHIVGAIGGELEGKSWQHAKAFGKDSQTSLVWMAKEHWGECKHRVFPKGERARRGSSRFHAPWPGDSKWP